MATIITGKDCEITIGSQLSQWNEYTFDAGELDNNEIYLPGSNEWVSIDRGKKAATLTAKGYMGGDESFADLVDVGDEVTSIDGTNLPANIDSAYGTWKVTKKSMTQGDAEGSYSLELKSNFPASGSGS